MVFLSLPFSLSLSLSLSTHYEHYQMHNYKHCSYLWQGVAMWGDDMIIQMEC